MKKRNLYLHIGTEKTGTTSIQECLYINRKKLSDSGYHFLQSMGERNNRKLVCYAMNKTKDEFYKFTLAKFSTQKALRDNIQNQLEKELNKIEESIENVIISSEHFHSRICMIEEVNDLKILLKKYFHKITVICYLREQSDTYKSLYSTSIKAGNKESFEQMGRNCSKDNIYFNYFKLLQMWSDSFGQENITLRIFDKDRLLNNNILDDFFNIIEPQLIKNLDLPKRTNLSLSDEGLKLGLLINKGFSKLKKNKERNVLKNNILKIIDKKFSGRNNILTPEIYERIFNEFAESNINLSKTYFYKDENCFIYSPPLEKFENDESMEFNAFISIIENFLEYLKNIEINNQKKINDSLVVLNNLKRINSNSLRAIEKLIDMN